ncbi:MAG: AbiV family abortive infection protein, partial [Nitrososphaeraceae archaeon]
MSDKDPELIDYPHVGVGMYLALRNAKRHFEDAKFLYDHKKFQSAIPIFIICIEECFKSHELSIKLRKKQSVSQTEWGNLMKHEHKLNFVNEFVIGNIENMTEEQFETYAKETNNDEFIKYRKEIIQRNKAEKNITSQLQFLKEECLYQNWNKVFDEWDDFDFLKPEQKEDLAFFIMKRAAIQISQLHFGIEYAINILRRDGAKLTNLEYPKYNEFRDIKNYDTKLDDYDKIIEDFPKYHRGEKIMLTLIAQKAFGVIDQVHTNEVIRKCLKLAQKKDFDNWYPHSIIKAIFLATSNITKTSEDGNYYGIADDSDQTYEGKPMMYSIAIVSKKGDMITIEKIVINEKEYDTNDKIIEQILETETIIEQYPGKEIPLEKMHEAYS